MYEFEATLRLLLTIGIALGIVLAGGFGFKRLFRKSRDQISDSQLAALEDRLAGLDARLGEMEERIDFTERMLADVKNRLQLPGKT